MKNILSFDIEDWFHIMGIPELEDPKNWDDLPSIVVDHTVLILKIIREADVKATFFMLGWVAERYPSLIRMICNDGHEVATHSYWHRKVFQLTAEEFYKDLKRSIDVIEQQSGQKVVGFRAPSFSIIPGCEWAFDVLWDLGLEYDASLFPSKRSPAFAKALAGRSGGYPCQKQIHIIKEDKAKGKKIMEIPMSMINIGPLKLPFSGGGYLRVMPKSIIRFGFEQNIKRKLPVNVYLHPRDFAVDCPRIPMPLFKKFKCYTGLKTTQGKLKMLLENYEFDTCSNVLEEWKKRKNFLAKPQRKQRSQSNFLI